MKQLNIQYEKKLYHFGGLYIAIYTENSQVKVKNSSYLNILFIDETDGAVEGVQTFSLISFSLISQAKIVGFSLLYCSILLTT